VIETNIGVIDTKDYPFRKTEINADQSHPNHRVLEYLKLVARLQSLEA
jgi:hypothetical protein